jgi:hypothetical protein
VVAGGELYRADGPVDAGSAMPADARDGSWTAL